MDKNEYQPPATNRGAESTPITGLRALVDWVSITFKNVGLSHFFDLLGIEEKHFMQSKQGGKGYKQKLFYGGISVYYDGAENMGIHLEISGNGCREYELHSRYTWIDFFSVILLLDINITRLDLAIDDFKGYFTIKKVMEKVKRTHLRTRFKSATDIKKYKLSNAEIRGHTVYFGSPQSMIQIRIYDKLLEREEAGKQLDHGYDFWQRTEIQMRDDRAKLALIFFATSVADVGKLASGILKNYINFLVPNSTDTNKRRWKVCKWWDNFLGDVDQISLSIKAPDVTVERSYKWADKQWKVTAAMLYEAFNQDVTLFFDLINDGLRKMDKKHLKAVETFKKQYKDISFEEFAKTIKKDLNM